VRVVRGYDANVDGKIKSKEAKERVGGKSDFL
jgi:hypothetical protein